MKTKKDLIKAILSFPAVLFSNINKSDYYDFSWIKKASSIFNLLRFFIPLYPFTGFMYKHVRTIKNHVLEFNDEVVFVSKLMSFFDLSSDNEKKFIFDLLVYLNIFSDDISKRMVRFAKETNNKDFRYWITMDISKITFTTQKGIYDDYYIDRRELLRLIAVEHHLEIKERKKKKSGLCVVTYMLDQNDSNSMQRVARMFTNGLTSFYKDIYVVSLEVFSCSFLDMRKCNTLYAKKKSSKSKTAINKAFGDGIKVYYAEGKTYAERMQASLDIISNINPEYVIDISDEYSAQSFLYYKLYRSFYFSLRSFTTSTFCCKYLAPKDLTIKYNQRFKAIDDLQCEEWIFPEYVPEHSHFFIKENIGFAPDDFIVISIGINGDLFSSDFIDLFCGLMKSDKNIKWLLVGGGASQYLKRNYIDLLNNKQIIEWGREKNLYGLCACCSAVLRPNLTGGSGGTAIAAMNGLPIVMSTYVCDPMRWLGINYSTLTTSNEMVEYIFKLKNDRDFYNFQKQRTLRLISHATDQKLAWDALNNILQRDHDI